MSPSPSLVPVVLVNVSELRDTQSTRVYEKHTKNKFSNHLYSVLLISLSCNCPLNLFSFPDWVWANEKKPRLVGD